ncbi:MAG: aminoacetone oxidase family FAD-binding enzyme [Oscillospiraceae bacterium]|nr:aminoacetone oxidase family FAD-binding enzyme [Oscillospiraceae bacterium]
MVIGIIGAGASGMAAALAAAENPNATVILLERQARVGRKLQATGNGRCNLTNLQAEERGYHGEQPEFAQSAIRAFGPAQTRDWFASLGLYTVAEPSGKVYPYSDQANSVVDVLRLNLVRENIVLKTDFEVDKIQKTPAGFLLTCGEEQIACNKLIVACGGLAGSKLGGSMSGYKLLGKLGHRSTRLRPSLVQIKTAWSGITALKGVRANCTATILKDGLVYSKSNGEIQFTEQGISGPVIFEISRDVCYGGGDWCCCLDFLPDWTEEQLKEQIARRCTSTLPMEELLTGILHNRLGRVLTKAAGISGKQWANQLSDREEAELIKTVKAFELELTEPLGMDSAQVTAGGVLTDGFDPNTMESRLVPGLYACGEVLDIDGDCGGYNLQWAWSSGRCAGIHAGKESQ